MAKTNQIAVRTTPAGSEVLERLRKFWDSRTSRQRTYLIAGAVVTLATVGLLSTMLTTPEYKPVISGLQAADAQAVSAELAAKKIPYTISPDGGSISVPADQADAARLELASHDAPHSGRVGYEIFDKVSWGETEFDEKVNYQRALEGELEQTIQTMSNIRSVRVHLVMATDSVFMDRERQAKASVTLRLKSGGLSREQVSAITRLVAGAVDELKPEDVSVVDADSDRWLTSNGNNPGGSDQLEQDLTQRLLATLGPVVGADHIHATVNVEYETGSSEENEEKYDPAVSVPLSMQSSQQTSGSGKVIGGVPGTSSNVPGSSSKTSPVTDSGESSKTESASYGVNRVTRHVIEPAGGIKRITAAIVLDDIVDRKQVKDKWVETVRKRSPDEIQLIGGLAQAAIGFNAARGDVISVQNLAFEKPDVPDVPLPNLAERAQKGLDTYASTLRYGAMALLFVLVYLLMIRPLQKKALASDVELEVQNEPLLAASPEAQSADPAASAAAIAHRSLLLKKELSDFVRDDPESSTTAVRAWLREETL